MAAVKEKIPPTQLSIGASVVGVIIGGLIFWAGWKKPQVWTSQMAISHHASYGAFECMWCHNPQPNKYGTGMTCSSMDCHQEFEGMGGVYAATVDEAVQKMLTLEYTPAWTADAARHHYELHLAAQSVGSCMACHSEHSNEKPKFPPGFSEFKPTTAHATEWKSIRPAEVALAD